MEQKEKQDKGESYEIGLFSICMFIEMKGKV